MKDLIAELEAAPEGSRELSDKVLLAIGWIGQSAASQQAGILIPHWKSPDGRDVPSGLRPSPTESLDAALTLVPEGYGFAMYAVSGGQYEATVQSGGSCIKPSLPLALCIASLRARQAMEEAA